ncbi:hypothetical protein [Allosphingosinicella deserti]|uniref:Uncharacterized protein n=1 Tax=Allosphingosinicella deserti TaxID=2116704 RepID=A0A2P7QVD6_9SPHN|nr:hypothetical protein [Sphingomonas deserti]PSJ41937.1 hypothetical protein C7I55_06655 [Sphingomonas deserti]
MQLPRHTRNFDVLGNEAIGLTPLVGRFDTDMQAAAAEVRNVRPAPVPRVCGKTALALQPTLADAAHDGNAF